MTNKLSKEIVNNLVYLLKNNSFELLLSKTSNLIDQFPNSIFLLNLNGIANANLKRYEKSLKSFEKILSIDINSLDALYNIGNLKKEIGEIEIAKKFFQKTIELNKNYYQAYNSLGIIYKYEKNFKEAEYCFKYALKINNKHYQSLINLGLLSQLNNNHSEAINYFANSYKIQSNKNSLIYLGNSLVYHRFVECRPDLYNIIYDLLTINNLVSPANIMKSIISLIIQEVEISKIYNLDTQINSIEVFNKIVREISMYNCFLEIIKLCHLSDYEF